MLCGIALGACVTEPRTAERAVLALAVLGSVAMTALAVLAARSEAPPRWRHGQGSAAPAAWDVWDAGLPRPQGLGRNGLGLGTQGLGLGTQGLGSGRLCALREKASASAQGVAPPPPGSRPDRRPQWQPVARPSACAEATYLPIPAPCNAQVLASPAVASTLP